MSDVECPDEYYLSCGIETVAYTLNGVGTFHTKRFCSKDAAVTKGLGHNLNQEIL